MEVKGENGGPPQGMFSEGVSKIQNKTKQGH